MRVGPSLQPRIFLFALSLSLSLCQLSARLHWKFEYQMQKYFLLYFSIFAINMPD